MRAATPTRNVTVFAPVDVHALEVAGVMDVFNEANAQAGCAALYAVTLAAERREAIRCSSGLRIVPDLSVEDPAPDADTLIVAGSYGIPGAPSEAVIAWLRRRSLSARRYGAVCTGAFLAGAADPAWLTLELTESLMAEDSPEILGLFRRLRELGIGLSIDDFGTGYSSLRYLERFPLTEIKIDRSFVAGLPASPAKRVIVEAVIKLGAELGVRVIAEGVEREAERDALAAMGCAFAQGYLFSPPLDAEAFAAMAADRRSEAPA
jgi:putative intracellular protease/amidase